MSTSTLVSRQTTLLLVCWLLFSVAIDASAASPSPTAPSTGSGSPPDPEALVALALRYEHAEGVPRDFDRALQLFCQAAERGSASAAYNLAVMRLNGRGVPQSDRKAVSWLQLA